MASKPSVAGATSPIQRYKILRCCFLQNTQIYIPVPGLLLRNRHSDLPRAERLEVRVPVGGKRYSLLHIRSGRPWGPSSLLYDGYWGHSPGINEWGMILTTHPHLAPLCACIACYGEALACLGNIPGSDPCFAVFDRATCNHSRRTISVRPSCTSFAALIVLTLQRRTTYKDVAQWAL
jgi:hypothetical protein